YCAAKRRLFEGVGAPPPRVAVINGDDSWGSEMLLCAVAHSLDTMRYGLRSDVEYSAEEITFSPGETRFRFRTPHGTVPMRSHLAGRVNVYNLLAASC